VLCLARIQTICCIIRAVAAGRARVVHVHVVAVSLRAAQLSVWEGRVVGGRRVRPASPSAAGRRARRRVRVAGRPRRRR